MDRAIRISDEPRQYSGGGEALADALRSSIGNAQTYATRLADFTTRWQAAMAKWQLQAAPLKGGHSVEHLSWVYMENWLGLKRVVALEPKPGVPRPRVISRKS